MNQSNVNQCSSLPDRFPLVDGIHIHSRGNESQFVLEDTGRGKFYRLGRIEMRFIEAVIETESASKAYQMCQESPAGELSLENSIKLCKWLAINGLAHDSNPASSIASVSAQPKGLVSSIYFCQFTLLNPDRILKKLGQMFGWIFSPVAMAIGLIVFVIGLIQTTGHWAEFASSYQNLFSSWRWIFLAFAWFGLKIIHEIAHGATCRRYGGEVKKAGIAMILLMPIAFVDVTSSWRFKSRWQRLHVTLAGIAAELFIAGLALIAWNMFGSLPLKQAAADVVLLASVSSLLFNLNPLLKFDGYFAIADATGVDNLYSFGQRYARYFGSRFILGLDSQPPKLPEQHAGWIKIYGLSAALYRVFTVTGLIVAAAAIFHGAGIIIAIAGILSYFIKPIVQLFQHLGQLKGNEGLNVPRLAIRVCLLLAVVVAPLWMIPAQWDNTTPAIVEYDPPSVLRNRTAGFVEAIYVRDGQNVVDGQPILKLRNEELELEFSELQKTLAHVQLELNAARWRGNSSELKDAQSRETALQQQIVEMKRDVAALEILSPCEGTLLSRRLAVMQGSYLEPGQELAVVGREQSKRLKLSIRQSDASSSNELTQQLVRVNLAGEKSWTATLERIETRASLSPPDDSLISVNGGPLAVIATSADEFELCEPRVNAYVSLTPEQSIRLKCGQRAYVQLSSQFRQSIGGWAVTSLTERMEFNAF